MKQEQASASVTLKNELLKRNAELIRAIRGRTEPEIIRGIRSAVSALRSEIIESERATAEHKTALLRSSGYLSPSFPEPTGSMGQP